jgi:hypothetical protein
VSAAVEEPISIVLLELGLAECCLYSADYKIIKMLSLALLACTMTASLAFTAVPIRRLPMELHGAGNDLDMIPQAAAKGIRWFKMDVSMCTRASCEAFSTFGQPGAGGPEDCFFDDVGRELCCVCLRGDASSRPNLPSPFNTSYDLLSFLDDHSQAWWLTDQQNPLRIGLDFGLTNGTFSLLNKTSTNLIWNMLLGIQERILRYNLQLQPYFDSTLNGWFQQLDQLCESGQCNEVLELLDNLPWASETGGGFPSLSDDPKGRFKILNSDWQSYEQVCAAGWNNSIGTGRMIAPPMWWEPSSQIELWAMFEAQKKCTTFPNGYQWMSQDLNDAFTVVTNQASEMFEVYTSSFGTNRGLNALIASSSQYTNPRMAIINKSNASKVVTSKYDRFAMIAAQRKSDNGYDILSVGVIDGTAPSLPADVIGNISSTASTNIKAGSLVSTAAFDVTLSSTATTATPLGAASPSSLLLLADSAGDLTAVSINPLNGTVSISLVSTFPLVTPYFSSGATLLSAYPLCLGTNGTTCVVVALVQNGTAGVVVASATLSAGMGRFLGASTSPLFGTLPADKGATLALLPSTATTTTSFAFEGLAVISSTISHGINVTTTTAGSTTNPLQDEIDTLLRSIVRESCGGEDYDYDAAEQDDSTYEARSKLRCDATTLKRLWREKVAEKSRETSGVGLTFSRGELFASYLQVTFNMMVTQGGDDSSEDVVCSVSFVTKTTTAAASLTSLSTPRRVGIGSSPHISVMMSPSSSSSPSEPMAFLTYTDGTCTNGLIMNNADTSKCMIPLPQSDDDLVLNAFQSVPYLLNYAYGSLDAWVNTMETNVPYEAYVSMCNADGGLHTGKFDCGFSPSGALFQRSVIYSNATEAPNGPATELAAMVLHDGSVLCPLQTTIICGSPLPHDGLTLDNFRLVQPGFMV